MKAIVVGFVVWVIATILDAPALGLLLGVAAIYLVRRLDELEKRVTMLQRGTELAEGAAHPSAGLQGPPAPPAPPPAPTAVRIPPNPLLQAAMAGAQEGPRQITGRNGRQATPRPPRISMEDLEQLFAGRLLAVVGGLALILGGVFFLSLAFSRGWIGPEARVVLGLVVGAVLFGVGGWFLLRPGGGHRGGERVREVLGNVLIAAGLAVTSLALFAATRLYDFISPELGVGAALVVAAVTAAVAVAARSQLVAGFGLVAVLAAPPVMGAGATLLTMAFLGTALAGTTAICLFASWRWLPALAFVLTAPQLASYIATNAPDIRVALPALAIFWALNALAAAGEEVRLPRHRLSSTSASLLVANGAFAVWAGFALLSGDLEPWRGLYLAGLGAAHLAVGSFFLWRDGERHPFGMLAFGSGIASVTLAIPVQFGAPIVPMAWAAEAVALAWVYAERKHAFSGAAALVLGGLSVGHLLTVEYPLVDWAAPAQGAIPFANPDGAAVAFVVLAAAAAILLLRRRAEKVGVAGVAVSVVALVLPWEMSGVPLVGAYALLASAGLLVERRLLCIPITRQDERPLGALNLADWSLLLADRALYGSAVIAGALGVWVAVSDYLTPIGFANGLRAWASLPPSPFADDRTAVAAIVVAAALVVGLGVSDHVWRWTVSLVAAGTIAYLVPFEAGPAWSVVAWLGLGLALHVLGTRWEVERRWATYALAAAAIAEVLLVVAAPDRLVVRGAPFPEPALFNGGTLAAAAMAAAFAARRFVPPADRDARVAGALAGAWAVYLLSIGTVDIFQAQLGGTIALEELQKQAQVALSVLWALLGVSGFVLGLARRISLARLSGLALLGIVTVKVFVVDLAALDVAYRVLSFVALGSLLLGAAYLSTRLQPGPNREQSEPETSRGP
jgi:uncharacterized membrane protein